MAKKTLRKLMSLVLTVAVAANLSGAALAASIVDNKDRYEDGQLQEAINNAKESVTLISDEEANVTIDKDITLDLNGHTLSGDKDKNQSVVSVKGDDVNVTITSSATETDEKGETVVKNGTITGGNASNGGGIKVNNSTVTVEHVTITGNTSTNVGNSTGGGGIYVKDGTAIVKDVTITGNTAVIGGGIQASNSKVTMENVTITDNTAKNGGGIAVYNGTLDVKNSEISGNTAQIGNNGAGGGIHVTAGGASGSTSSVTIENTVIAKNTAAENGGGVYNDDPGKNGVVSTVTITNSTISGNTAETFGGGIDNGGNMTIQDSKITGNIAYDKYSSHAGGGIYAAEGKTEIKDTEIIGNTAVAGGGGIGVYEAEVTITGGSLYGNKASHSGNDLNVSGGRNPSSVTISNVKGMDVESKDYHYQAGYADGGVINDRFQMPLNANSAKVPNELTNGAAVTSAAVYTVTYVDGNGNALDAIKYLADDTHTVLPNAEAAGFVRDGYTFTGWTDSKGNPVDATSLKMTGDVTLVAQWEESTPPGGGGSDPDPTPDPDPDPDPDPEPTDPELPDPELPDPDMPLTELPEEEVPLEELPEEEIPLEELPEEEIPLEELPEEEVPLSEIPQTGDTSALWVLTLAVSGLALAWLLCTNKKREQAI